MKFSTVVQFFTLCGRELAEFARWWWTQLLECVRALVGFIVPRSKVTTIVSFERTGGDISVIRKGKRQPLLSFRVGSNGAWPADLRPFGSIEIVKRARAAAALTADLVLTRIILLPDATERQLSQVLPLYLEREFPITLDAIAWFYAIKRRLKATRQIEVEVAIVRRDTLLDIEAAMRRWELQVARVGVKDGDQLRGNFLAPPKAIVQKRITRVDRWLMVSAAVFALATVGCVVGQWWYERYQLGRELQTTTQSARRVQRVAEELNTSASPAQQLASIAAQPDAADLVYLLTERTPADTWIYQLSIDARGTDKPQLTLAAVTPPSLDYLKTLGSIPGFEQVALTSTESNPGNASLKRAFVSVGAKHEGNIASGQPTAQEAHP